MASHTVGTKDCIEKDEFPVFRLHITHSKDGTSVSLRLIWLPREQKFFLTKFMI